MRKRRIFLFVFLILFGIFAILNVLSRPRLSAVHGADIVQLVAAGFCFGMGSGVLLGAKKVPGEDQLSAQKPPVS
jgi:hypothetical protein